VLGASVVRRVTIVNILPLLAIACLGTLPHDRSMAALVDASADVLLLPRVEQRRDWLLREAAGWCGAHQASFGGRTADTAAIRVRGTRFRGAAAARAAATRVTPAYVGKLVHDRLVTPPRRAESPGPAAPPDALVTVLVYGGRVSEEVQEETGLEALPVQVTLLQFASVVVLIEDFGLAPERRQALVEALVHAAQQVPDDGC
jgi:hypothetical protein